MAEGESEESTKDTSSLPPCLWTKLPRELQNKVLSYLPLRNLFQVRCVCKDWRYVIHRRGFRSMYDAMYIDEYPSPAICYTGSYYPSSLEWSLYDYALKRWKTMRCFPAQTRVDQYLIDQSVYSVEGLLCLLLWKQEQKVRTHFPWLVWNPLTNKSKPLPPCKHKTVNRGTFFVHAFADTVNKSYKLLMAHNPKQQHYQYMETDASLITEIYDSATGTWRESPEYKLRLPLSPSFNQAPKRGMLCNGVIHFVTRATNENVLLSYDIAKDEWHEEITDEECMEIFEWDGRVMTAMPLPADEIFSDETGYRISLFERNPATKQWVDTGVEIPFKIRNKFVEDEEGVEIAASGNHLAITGYTRDGSFRIAVYKREEKYWRFPPTGAFSDKMRQARIEGLFQFKPRLLLVEQETVVDHALQLMWMSSVAHVDDSRGHEVQSGCWFHASSKSCVENRGAFRTLQSPPGIRICCLFVVLTRLAASASSSGKEVGAMNKTRIFRVPKRLLSSASALVALSLTHIRYKAGDCVGWVMGWLSLLPVFLAFGGFTTLLLFRRELQTFFFALGLLICETSNQILKNLVRESRPPTCVALEACETFGWPSGHSQFMLFFASYLTGLATTTFTFSAAYVKALTIALPWALCPLVMYSRVYLGYHSVAQVLAGAALGLLLGLLWFWCVRRFFHPQFRRFERSRVCRFLRIKDSQHIPDVIGFEYRISNLVRTHGVLRFRTSPSPLAAAASRRRPRPPGCCHRCRRAKWD